MAMKMAKSLKTIWKLIPAWSFKPSCRFFFAMPTILSSIFLIWSSQALFQRCQGGDSWGPYYCRGWSLDDEVAGKTVFPVMSLVDFPWKPATVFEVLQRYPKYVKDVKSLENYVLVVNASRIFLARQIVYKFYAWIKQTYTVPTYDIHVAPPFGFCMDWLKMPGQSRRKKMSFLRTLQNRVPCDLVSPSLFYVDFQLEWWNLVKKTYVHAHLEDDMYVRADELYCLLNLDFWKANRFPFCLKLCGPWSHFWKKQHVCSQADDAVVLVPPTHSDLLMPHGLWATGVHDSLLDTHAQIHFDMSITVFWWCNCIPYMAEFVRFCMFMCFLQPTWIGSLVIVLFKCPLLFAHFCTGLC